MNEKLYQIALILNVLEEKEGYDKFRQKDDIISIFLGWYVKYLYFCRPFSEITPCSSTE
jgi:hypothetical protein